MRIGFPDATHQALVELADQERRDPRRQAEILVIESLHRRGLVSSDGLERTGEAARRQPEPAG